MPTRKWAKGLIAMSNKYGRPNHAIPVSCHRDMSTRQSPKLTPLFLHQTKGR
jgi:hypothetical protein